MLVAGRLDGKQLNGLMVESLNGKWFGGPA